MTWSDYIDDAKAAYDNAGGEGLSRYGDSAKSLINSMAITEYNAAEQEKAWQRQLDLIREQNQYNSPVEQMKRYSEAGLNPLLLYGQISPGQQSAIAQYQANRVDPSAGNVTEKEERFGRAMQSISMISSLAQGIADINKSVLSSELLNEQVRNAKMLNKRENWVNDMLSASWENLPVNGLDIDPAKLITSVLVPGLAKQDSTYSHIDYETSRKIWQTFFNEHILPLQEDSMKMKNNMLDYQSEMLGTMSPAMRQTMMMLLLFGNMFSKF